MRKNSKRGSVRDVMFAGIIIFVFAIGFFVVYFMLGNVSTIMLSNIQVNQTPAAVESIQSSTDAANRMDYVILGLFIGLSLAIVVSGFVVGGHPIFMIFYFIVVIVSVIVGAMLSNVWEDVSTASIFGTTITHFGMTNHLIVNLPIYMAIVAFLGMIAMFAKPYIMPES